MPAGIAPDIEWFVPEPEIEVRQGDVLISRDPHSGKVEEICLVITADCDISKGKFGRQLACLRVITLNEYVRTNWANRKLERMIRKESEKLRGQVAKWHTLLIGIESTLSTSAIATWVQREEPESICDSLQVPDTDRKKLIAALSCFRKAISDSEYYTSHGSLHQYVAFRAAVRGQDMNVCQNEVLQEAQKETQKESLPDDVFLLPSLPQIDTHGAVVLLREIIGIAYEAVCYRMTDARSRDALLRVGRLLPTFKYAVSQSFGALYSKIGLPDNYETRCKGVVANLNNFAWE